MLDKETSHSLQDLSNLVRILQTRSTGQFSKYGVYFGIVTNLL